jgi:hypothetical protein
MIIVRRDEGIGLLVSPDNPACLVVAFAGDTPGLGRHGFRPLPASTALSVDSKVGVGAQDRDGAMQSMSPRYPNQPRNLEGARRERLEQPLFLELARQLSLVVMHEKNSHLKFNPVPSFFGGRSACLELGLGHRSEDPSRAPHSVVGPRASPLSPVKTREKKKKCILLTNRKKSSPPTLAQRS